MVLQENDIGDWRDIPNWDSDKEKSIEEKTLKDRCYNRRINNDNIHFLKAKKLNDLCKKPVKGQQFRIITEKQFNAYSLILSALEEDIVKELYIAIYRINEPTVDSLIHLINTKKILKAIFVILNFFNQTKKPERWAIKLRTYCDNNKDCSHIYIHNHAKIVALHSGNNHYVFEGSGNLSDNARIEQYVYENNKKVFDFHKNWMLDLVNSQNN